MSAYDFIVSRLEGKRSYRPRPGLARATRSFCPAHQAPPHKPGRGRTLSVAETADGNVLLHCHSGCAAGDVLASLGLSLRDLNLHGIGNDHRKSGDSRGSAAWAAAASAADAVAEAALMIVLDPRPGTISLMLTATDEFSSLARAAMRGGR